MSTQQQHINWMTLSDRIGTACWPPQELLLLTSPHLTSPHVTSPHLTSEKSWHLSGEDKQWEKKVKEYPHHKVLKHPPHALLWVWKFEIGNSMTFFSFLASVFICTLSNIHYFAWSKYVSALTLYLRKVLTILPESTFMISETVIGQEGLTLSLCSNSSQSGSNRLRSGLCAG